MLARLSIRDVVLIDELDLEFSAGLTILTGETGAREVNSSGCAGARARRARRQRPRAPRPAAGQVTAVFDLPEGHAAHACSKVRTSKSATN